MIKDFLFFNYSWVPNSTFLFEKFREMGHDIDIVDETNLRTFIPTCKYKNVVLYLHENWTIPITNNLIDNYFQDSFLIQHDDTDFEQLQNWSNREPDLYMQREYTLNTIIKNKDKVIPFHFPIKSLFDENFQNKDIDVFFMGTITNMRRVPFIRHIENLSKTTLKNLNWCLDIRREDNRTPEIYKQNLNRSKICLHHFGNSYDAWRIWESISCNTALVMPKMRNLSVSEDHMPFNEYCVIRDDFQDIEEKINYLLSNDKYKEYAKRGFDAYNERHNAQKCFEYYYKQIMKNCKK